MAKAAHVQLPLLFDACCEGHAAAKMQAEKKILHEIQSGHRMDIRPKYLNPQSHLVFP